MTPKCLNVLVFILLTTAFDCLYAQTSPSPIAEAEKAKHRLEQAGLIFYNGLAPYFENELFGYIDTTGAFQIQPRFTDAGDFSYHLAPVQLPISAFYGYIDTKGKLRIPYQYDYAHTFGPGGVALVRKGGKESLIDTTGKVVFDAQNGWVDPINNGFARVTKEGKVGYVNGFGEIKIPIMYEAGDFFGDGMAKVRKNGAYGVIDSSNQILIPFEYEDIIIPPYVNLQKFCAVKQNGMWGFVALGGKTLIRPQYEVVGRRENGFWIFLQNSKMGLMDKELTVILPPSFEFINDFYLGYCNVRNQEKWGVIDEKGRLIVPCLYDEMISFYSTEGVTQHACVKKNGKLGVIDTNAQITIPIIYDKIFPRNAHPYSSPLHYDSDFFIVVANKKAGVVNAKGKIIVPLAYEAISFGCKNLVRLYASRNEKCGWATLKGQILSPPILPTSPCAYPETQIVTFPLDFGCENVKRDCDPIPYPCFQCEFECPDEEWLREKGYVE